MKINNFGELYFEVDNTVYKARGRYFMQHQIKRYNQIQNRITNEIIPRKLSLQSFNIATYKCPGEIALSMLYNNGK